MKKLLIAATVAFCVSQPYLGADGLQEVEVLQQVLVKVNGDIITKTDLEERQIQVLRQQSQTIGSDEAALRAALAEMTPRVIAEAVDELLLVQRAREKGYRLTNEQFDRILENIRKENNLESEEQFQAALTQEGMTMADLRKALERQMLVSAIQQDEILVKVNLTEEEERIYYEQHQDAFADTATVTLREILIAVPVETDESGRDQPVVNVARDEEARSRMEAIRARIVAGEDFATLAGQHSEAPSKANGGLIGPINRDELAPALLTRLDAMSEGDVSDVIRTSRGYQLLKVEALKPASVRPFEDVRDEIAQRVIATKRMAEFDKYMARLRSQAIIDWKNEELKKAYESYIASRTATATTPSPEQP